MRSSELPPGGMLRGRGCGGKLDFGSLSSLLGDHGRVHDDCHLCPPQGGGLQYVTVDDVEPFGEDAALAGRIAIAHVTSDLYARLVAPSWAVVALTVSQDDLSTGRAGVLLGGVSSGLSEIGAALLGGHTRRGSVTHLAITAGGAASSEPLSGVPTEGDVLLLGRKPLGSGALIAAVLAGVYDRVPREILQVLATTNAEQARWLGRLPTGALRGLTDVTGFGLLGAVTSVAGDVGWSLSLSALELFPDVLSLVRSGVHSPLMDANLRDFGEGVIRPGGADAGYRFLAAGCDPQTSGPLLALVDRTEGRRLLRGGAPFIEIGHVAGCDRTVRF